MAAKRKGERDNANLASLQAKKHQSTIHEQNPAHYKPESLQNSHWYEQRGPWIALFDWNSGYYYYQNLRDYQTQWEKPAEWDSIHPLYIPASQYYYGFFTGVRENSLDNDKQYNQNGADIDARIKGFLERPARRQIDPEEREKLHWIPEGVTEYNIWYDRWVGEHWREDRDHGPSETRCCLETDAGYTKANIYDPSGNKHYFCLYFSKGCCHLGPECGYLHVIPSDKDENRIDLAHDVFGRERHRLHKDDMGGVGAFNKECRVLYVGGLGSHDNLEKLLWTEFGEWGKIENIRIIHKRHIAFVRYKNRVNAEFAKVAMSNQKLNNREVLNVRWAFDDPNPKAQKEELLKSKQKVLKAATERGLLQAALTRSNQPSGDHVTGPYPNTDNQYPAECGPVTKEQIEQAQILQNVYNDCTRLDEAFKKMESLQTAQACTNEAEQTTDDQYNDIECSVYEVESGVDLQWSGAFYCTGQTPYRNRNHSGSNDTRLDLGSWELHRESPSTQDPYRQLLSKSESVDVTEVSTKSNELTD